MHADTNVYPPFWMSPLRLIIVCSAIVAVLTIRFLAKRALRRLALRLQRKASEQAQAKDPKLVAHALEQLDNLYAAYGRQELSASVAVEQASALVRETYDTVMNHRTRYQAHYEIASRRLETLSQLVQRSYPVEFAATEHVIAPEAVSAIFADAKKVLESCR